MTFSNKNYFIRIYKKRTTYSYFDIPWFYINVIIALWLIINYNDLLCEGHLNPKTIFEWEFLWELEWMYFLAIDCIYGIRFAFIIWVNYYIIKMFQYLEQSTMTKQLRGRKCYLLLPEPELRSCKRSTNRRTTN